MQAIWLQVDILYPYIIAFIHGMQAIWLQVDILYPYIIAFTHGTDIKKLERCIIIMWLQQTDCFLHLLPVCDGFFSSSLMTLLQFVISICGGCPYQDCRDYWKTIITVKVWRSHLHNIYGTPLHNALHNPQ